MRNDGDARNHHADGDTDGRIELTIDDSVLEQEQISPTTISTMKKIYDLATPTHDYPAEETDDRSSIFKEANDEANEDRNNVIARTENDDDDQQEEQEQEQENDDEEVVHRLNPSDNNLSFPDMIKAFAASFKANWKIELYEMFSLSWPILVSNICSSLLGTVDMAFVGRLGKEYLAAAALGNSLFHSMGFLAVGFISAQDTLISQATGAKNERMKRVVLQRSILIVSLISVFIFALLFFLEPLLLLMGQEATLSHLTARFVRFNLLGLWPYCMIRIFTRYLTAQRYIYYPMFNSLISVGINALMNLLLIRGVGFKGLGFDGAPLATSLTRIMIMISLMIYTAIIERRKHLHLYDAGDDDVEANASINRSSSSSDTSDDNEEEDEDEAEEMTSSSSSAHTRSLTRRFMRLCRRSRLTSALMYTLKSSWHFMRTMLSDTLDPRGIVTYIKLGIPAAAALCLEVWGFHVTTVLTGYLGNVAYVSAHSVIQNITVVTFMIPLAMATAISIRVGISIGAAEPERAKVASFIGFSLSILIIIVTSTIVFFARNVIAKLFTNDAEVISTVSSVILIAALYQVFDGAQVSLGGVLRGTGKQNIGAVANFLAYYVICLPIGCLLCFYFGWKLQGLWLGLLLGVLIVSILLVLYMMFRMNYYDEVEKARERVRESDIHRSSSSGRESSRSEDNAEVGQKQQNEVELDGE